MTSGSRRESQKRAPHSPPKRHEDKSERRRLIKYAAWAGSVVITATLTLLVTGVIPKILGQFVNGARIEDTLRHGSDIIAKESLFYPDGSGVPMPTVVPGSYLPSSELTRALARSEGVTSPAVQRQIREAGGIDVEQVYIRIILQGNRNEQIRVLNIQPIQLRRSQPLNGVFFDIGAQGENNNIQMGFNLDQPAPQALNFNESGLSSVPYFETNTISLADGEQVVLIVEAETNCYTAEFRLAIDYLIGGVNKQEIISNHGAPFEVTSYRYGRNNIMSYRRMFTIQNNFSVTPPTPAQLAQVYRRTTAEARSCPR